MRFLAVALLASSAAAASSASPSNGLHVRSPDWRDQIIYFAMIDRFDDGDPSNNDQHVGEYDPTENGHYSGGDLRGVARRLGYIQGLGATAVWITPPMANQWWDPLEKGAGYHGYWARDFRTVDAHYGTLEDYQRLSAALHQRHMYLVQDVVVNHMANCFSYKSTYDANDPTKNVVLNTSALPACGPVRPPFNQWNVTDPTQRAAEVFHWTPNISNYEDPLQQFNYQVSDLDDLNTENPVVADALKKEYAYWIKTVGIDAFRVDTAFYVPPRFFRGWLYDKDGIMAAAKSTGRERFLAFGEGFASDRAYEDAKARKIQSYMIDEVTGESLLPSMLDFPLYRTASDVFARGQATAELGYRMDSVAALHGGRMYVMPNFVDNHDVDRFLGGASVPALKQALLFIMSIPGIPVIYQGTEQGFTVQRAAMFKGGYGSSGVDHFDTSSELYRYIADLAKLRTHHVALRRGTPAVVKQSWSGAGAFAYTMTTPRQTALVIFNTAEKRVLADNIPTGLAPGSLLKGRYFIGGQERDAVVGRGGLLTLALPPRAGRVYLFSGRRAPVPNNGTIILTPLDGGVQTSDFMVAGTATSGTTCCVKLVVDGDLEGARSVPVQNGAFSAVAAVDGMCDPAVVHTVTAYDEQHHVASSSGVFRVNLAFATALEYPDPSRDDDGPGHHYAYPTDFGWGANHQMDIREVKILTAGRALRLEITTAKVTSTWNPQNGFDHVAFTIFIEVPGIQGIKVMPQQSASVPEGMTWSYRVRAHGWSNALFSSAGATDTLEGKPQTPAAIVDVDKGANMVRFTLPPSSLGNPATLAGAKVYVTTWDYDAGYRALERDPAPWAFSGRRAATDPLIMDDTPLLTVP